MLFRHSLLIAIGIVCSGCTGKIGDSPSWSGNPTNPGGPTDPTRDGGNPIDPDGGTGGSDGGVVACASAATRRVRRLSQREYFNVVSDLLGPAAAPQAAGMLPPEPNIAGFDNQDVALRVSSAFQEGIANVAQKLSAAVDAVKLAPCATPTGSPACLQTFTQSFAPKPDAPIPPADACQ